MNDQHEQKPVLEAKQGDTRPKELPGLDIYQRLLGAASEVDFIKKDKEVSGFGGGYKAVTHDAVVGEVRPALLKWGIVVTFNVVDYRAEHHEIKGKNGTRTVFEVVAKVEVNFVAAGGDMTNPLASRATCTTIGIGHDSGDKAAGKALSYAKKYALLQALLLQTGVNDEERHDGMTQAERDAAEEEADLKRMEDEERKRNKEADKENKAKAMQALENLHGFIGQEGYDAILAYWKNSRPTGHTALKHTADIATHSNDGFLSGSEVADVIAGCIQGWKDSPKTYPLCTRIVQALDAEKKAVRDQEAEAPGDDVEFPE